MTNEHHTAKKWQRSDSSTPPSGAADAMTPDEQLEFENRIVQGEEPSAPADDADEPDRLTKSGRLDLEQIKEAMEKSDKDQ